MTDKGGLGAALILYKSRMLNSILQFFVKIIYNTVYLHLTLVKTFGC